MNQSWKTLAERIDALSLRERMFLFLSLVVVCGALADWLWVSPARHTHQQLTRKFAQENAELQRLRAELQAKAAEPDPARLMREEMATLKTSVAAVNRDIAALSVSARGGMGLAEVLVHFLRRHNGLTLIRTSNLPADTLPVLPSGAGAAAPAATVVVRNGLELTVSGPYAELVRYVQTLESALPTLRWGSFRLLAEQQPPQLSLQVFLLGPNP